MQGGLMSPASHEALSRQAQLVQGMVAPFPKEKAQQLE
jgi:hypothetical protein